MDLAQIHRALMLAHHEIIEDPRNDAEGLDGASCGPHVKHLAQLAMGAAAEGVTAQTWRASIMDEFGSEVAPLVDQADACMHRSGLWPWPGP